MQPLTLSHLLKRTPEFASEQSRYEEPLLYGVTDGKAIGTYVERKFKEYLLKRYVFNPGSSSSGIDFPELEADLKVTSIRQPQSSSPFRSARQKIYGLGYHLLILVYEKYDLIETKSSRLEISHVIFLEKQRTADYQMTRGILQILENEGNSDDLAAFILDKNLPVDDIEATSIAEEILRSPPQQGYLTISNALQWRLQYGRAIKEAGMVPGIKRII